MFLSKSIYFYVFFFFFCFSSKYQTPSISEGVEEIVNINFVPHFKNSQQESLYKMYLL